MATPAARHLLRSSLTTFRQDIGVIWVPIACGFALTAATVGLWLLAVRQITSFQLANWPADIAIIAGLFVATLGTTFINVVVVFCATDRIEGRRPDVRAAFTSAWGRRGVIVRWTVLAFAVGSVLRVIERRTGPLGAGIFGLLGALAWGAATLLVEPVLAYEGLGPVTAVRHSAGLVRRRFGPVAKTALGFGGLFAAWLLVFCAVVIVGIVLIASSQPLLGIPVTALGALGVVAFIQVGITAGTYVQTILYRFATDQPVPDLGVDLTATFQKGSSALVARHPTSGVQRSSRRETGMVDLLFRLDGRITRSTWWAVATTSFGIYIAALIVFAVDVAEQGVSGPLSALLIAVVWIALLAVNVFVGAKRLHDRDKSAWWLALALVPLVGWAWALIELGCLPGTSGENRFGPDPTR